MYIRENAHILKSRRDVLFLNYQYINNEKISSVFFFVFVNVLNSFNYVINF